MSNQTSLGAMRSFHERLAALTAKPAKPAPVAGFFVPARCNQPTGPDKEMVTLAKAIVAADAMHAISTACTLHLKAQAYGGKELPAKAARREERRVAAFLGHPELQVLEAQMRAARRLAGS